MHFRKRPFYLKTVLFPAVCKQPSEAPTVCLPAAWCLPKTQLLWCCVLRHMQRSLQHTAPYPQDNLMNEDHTSLCAVCSKTGEGKKKVNVGVLPWIKTIINVSLVCFFINHPFWIAEEGSVMFCGAWERASADEGRVQERPTLTGRWSPASLILVYLHRQMLEFRRVTIHGHKDCHCSI